MSSSYFNLSLVLLAIFIANYPMNVSCADYTTSCTCSSVSSSVCMSYSCTTTAGGASCFPGSSQIALQDGSFKALSDISIGDRVLINEKNVYEPVIAFLHGEQEGLFEFLAFDIQSPVSNMSSKMFVSANHLIFDFDSRKARFAGSFHVGDRLQFIENGAAVPAEIISIRLAKEKGYFAPMTPSGTIVVNGVLASIYATVSNHDFAHQMMGIYRWWINVAGAPALNKHLHWVLKSMMEAEKLVRWSGADIVFGHHLYDGTFQVSALP